MEIQVLQTCFGIYLVLAVPAFVLLWAILVASKSHDDEIQEHDL